MSVGQPERATLNRVIRLFNDELHYRYLGDWTDRDGNSNIDEGLLTAYLTKSGYTPAQISRAIYALRTEADNPNRSLYANIADELEAAGYNDADITRIQQQLHQYLDLREIIRKASGESLDLKAYEADMRHLIDTYIEADEPRKISPFDNMGLLELIVKTGIAETIATRLGEVRDNKNAVAETIENNVRSKIIKEHLNDPAYYEKMSALLAEIIADRKANAIQYEEYLKRIAELAKKVEAGQAPETPPKLDTPGKRALFNNLKMAGGASAGGTETGEAGDVYAVAGDQAIELALKIDATVRQVRPDDWRGVQAREQVIKAALYGVLQDVAEVERIFLIVKAQKEY